MSRDGGHSDAEVRSFRAQLIYHASRFVFLVVIRLVLDKTQLSSHSTRRVRPTRSNHGPSRPHFPAPFSILVFLFLLALSPRARHSTSFKPRHKTSTIYAFQSWPFPLSLPTPFYFTLSYMSGFALSNNVLPTLCCYHAASVCTFFYLIYPSLYVLILSLFNHHHRHPRGRPYNTDLRGSTHVYKTALLLVEEGIDPNQPVYLFFSLFSLISVPSLFSSTALWNCCPRDLGPSL